MSKAARLAAIGRLVDAACRKYGLRPPDKLLVEPRQHRKWYGLIERKGNRWTIRLSRPKHDPMPAYTLAHELAHLRHWKHGRSHARLTLRILSYWHRKHVADLRRIG